MVKKKNNTSAKAVQRVYNRFGTPIDGMKIISRDAVLIIVDLPQAFSRPSLLKDGSLGWMSVFPDGQKDKDFDVLSKWLGNNNACYVSSINGEPVKPTFPMALNTFEIATYNDTNPEFRAFSAMDNLIKEIDKKRDEFLLLCNKIVEFYVVRPTTLAVCDKVRRAGYVCFVQYCIVGFGKKNKSTRKTH